MTNERKSLRHLDRAPVHPGAILREDVLPHIEVGKGKLANALGISRQMLHGILSEKHPITIDMAVRLGYVLGNGPNLWVNMQHTYDIWHAQRNIDLSKLQVLQHKRDVAA